MIRYYIYLLQLGFHPVAVVEMIAKTGKSQHKKRNSTQHNTIIENTKQKTNIKITLKHKSSI